MDLNGANIVLTRAPEDGVEDPLSAALRAEGARVLQAPMIGFVPSTGADAAAHAASVAALADMTLTVFTSPRAVAAVPHPGTGRHNAVALGRRTHAMALEAGWRVLNPVDLPDAASLVAWTTAHVPLSGARVFWPTSNLASPQVTPFKREGARVDVRIAYVTRPATALPADVAEQLRAGHVVAVVCMSPSAVEAWCALVPADVTRGLVKVAPGKTTATAWKNAGVGTAVVATSADAAAIIAALRSAPLPPRDVQGARR